jgi:hypothetical protein
MCDIQNGCSQFNTLSAREKENHPSVLVWRFDIIPNVHSWFRARAFKISYAPAILGALAGGLAASPLVMETSARNEAKGGNGCTQHSDRCSSDSAARG